MGLAPIGSLLSGSLVELGGTRLAFVVAGSVGLAATAFAVAGGRSERLGIGVASLAPLERGKAG